MRSLFKILAILASFATLYISPSANAKDQYILGIFPYISSPQLLRLHLPLRYYLEEKLGKPVILVTAPNFHSFVKRTRDGEYDFVLTAPHLGWLAEKRDGYQFIAGTANKIQGVFLSHKDAGIDDLKDIKGKSLAIAAPLSLLHQMAVETLKQNELEVEKDIELKIVDSHSDTLTALIRGESSVSITPVHVWQKYGTNYNNELKVIGHTEKSTGLLFLANGSVEMPLVEEVRKALVAFNTTANGNLYLSYTGFRYFKKIDQDTRKSTEKYLSFAQN